MSSKVNWKLYEKHADQELIVSHSKAFETFEAALLFANEIEKDGKWKVIKLVPNSVSIEDEFC